MKAVYLSCVLIIKVAEQIKLASDALKTRWLSIQKSIISNFILKFVPDDQT